MANWNLSYEDTSLRKYAHKDNQNVQAQCIHI